MCLNFEEFYGIQFRLLFLKIFLSTKVIIIRNSVETESSKFTGINASNLITKLISIESSVSPKFNELYDA